MRWFSRGAVLAAFLCTSPQAWGQEPGAAPASAQAFRIDDSGSVVLDPVLRLDWQQAGRVGTSSPLVSASTKVNVQLNLTAWTGRTARIYMTLPRTSGPSVRATWTTGGTLLPGTLISGDRALVFAGPINGPLMRDLIDIKLEADGVRLVNPEALAFGFEIEVDQ